MEDHKRTRNPNIKVSIGRNTNKISRIGKIFVYGYLLTQLEIGEQVPKIKEKVSKSTLIWRLKSCSPFDYPIQLPLRQWRREAGYYQQNKVENTFYRYKTILGS